jgi:NhaP-type Na+/H+ or K+/H+ antiporter
VENPSVPISIRQALDIEGGLNDGITMPFLVLTIAFAISANSEIGHGEIIGFAAGQIVFGVLVGLVTGYLGAKYIHWGKQSGWMSTRFLKICWLALIILTFALAEWIGGNGYIASFVFGITSGNVIGNLEEEPVLEFADAETSLLMLATYVIFGMVMLTEALDSITLPVVIFALLSLTVVRMLPVAISMIGTRLRAVSVLYMGWFGPRGIATILYVITVIGGENIAGRNTIYDVAILTVALSLILHGITAWPLSEWYGKRMADLDRIGKADAEMTEVPEMSTRAGRRETGDYGSSVSETAT